MVLLSISQNSDNLKQAYLSKQKQLSDQKLAERLKKRRQEKELKAQRAATLADDLSLPLPPSTTASTSTTATTTMTKGSEEGQSVSIKQSESESESRNVSQDLKVASVAQLCWDLLSYSQLLALSRAQHKFVYTAMTRRATKLLAAKGKPS